MSEDPLDEDLEEAEPSVDEGAPEGISGNVLSHYEKVAKRMYMFPSNLLKELNNLIDSNTVTSAAKLRDVMKDRYKGVLKVPSLTVIRGYVVLRQHQKKKLDEARRTLKDDSSLVTDSVDSVAKQSQSIYQDLTLSVENKKSLLENLIKLCNNRIEAIKTLQQEDPSSSYETALGAYIREMRALTETLIKLRNELKTEGEQELDNYIKDKLSSILRSVVQAYTSLHGQDRIDAFRNMLKVRLRENKLGLHDEL